MTDAGRKVLRGILIISSIVTAVPLGTGFVLGFFSSSTDFRILARSEVFDATMVPTATEPSMAFDVENAVICSGLPKGETEHFVEACDGYQKAIPDFTGTISMRNVVHIRVIRFGHGDIFVDLRLPQRPNGGSPTSSACTGNLAIAETKADDSSTGSRASAGPVEMHCQLLRLAVPSSAGLKMRLGIRGIDPQVGQVARPIIDQQTPLLLSGSVELRSRSVVSDVISFFEDNTSPVPDNFAIRLRSESLAIGERFAVIGSGDEPTRFQAIVQPHKDGALFVSARIVGQRALVLGYGDRGRYIEPVKLERLTSDPQILVFTMVLAFLLAFLKSPQELWRDKDEGSPAVGGFENGPEFKVPATDIRSVAITSPDGPLEKNETGMSNTTDVKERNSA